MQNFFILKNNDFSFVSQAMKQIEINLDFENKYNKFFGFNKFIQFFYEYYKRPLPSIPEEIIHSKTTKIISSQDSLIFFKDMFESIDGNFGSKNDEGDQKRVCTIPTRIEQKKIEIIEQALLLLSDLNPWIYDLMKLVVTYIVPCETMNKPLGVSGGTFLGIILFSLNNRTNSEFDITKLSVKIAHEVAHQVLFIYEYLEPIINKKNKELEIYSPQRKVNRKLFPAFHAIAVSFYELFVYEKIIHFKNISAETKERHFTEACELTSHIERAINEMENLNTKLPSHTEEIIKECLSEFFTFKKLFT